NFTIDLLDERLTCFTLMDTDRYVVIRNVTLKTYKDSSCHAFHLNNVSNIKIENTTIVDSDCGIHMTDVTNFSLKESSIRADGYSIYSVGGNNLSVRGTLSDNIDTIRGFAFINGRNITIDRCTMKTKFTGLEFTNSQSFHIQNTTFHQNTGSAITITGGADSMIYNNTLLSSWISSSYVVKILTHVNFSMESNDFSTSNLGPTYIADCENGILIDNNFSNKGLYLEGKSHNLSIPESNLVDGKVIKYYENTHYLNVDGGSFGQVIINNVNHSHFSNFIIEGSGYVGFQMINTWNNTIDLCQIDNALKYGIAISYSHNFTVQNNSLFGNYIGISMRESSFGVLINNSLTAIDEYYGIYAILLSNVTLLQNTISGYSTGMYLRSTENVTGYYNTFIGCTFDFGAGTTNVIFDDTNTKDGKPMYYYYGVSNRILDLGTIGELYIQNCQHLLILNTILEGTNDGIMIYDSYDIGFFNITVSNSTYYLLQAEDVMNLTIMNSTFQYSDDYGFYFYNVTNLVIMNCLFGNISGYPASFEDVTNVIFSQNWIVNCSGPIYFDEFDYVTITDNCYVNNETEWLELQYDTGNEMIVLDNNLNQSAYDPSYFPAVGIDDIMGYMDLSGVPDSDDTGTDTGTSLIPAPFLPDSSFNWGQFILIVGIFTGLAAAGVLIFFVLKAKKNQPQQP
ncbi:MAG: right-handed parallel beta-helix repeat-containing protein, partial [Promethearchaeota archaeon]